MKRHDSDTFCGGRPWNVPHLITLSLLRAAISCWRLTSPDLFSHFWWRWTDNWSHIHRPVCIERYMEENLMIYHVYFFFVAVLWLKCQFVNVWLAFVFEWIRKMGSLSRNNSRLSGVVYSKKNITQWVGRQMRVFSCMIMRQTGPGGAMNHRPTFLSSKRKLHSYLVMQCRRRRQSLTIRKAKMIISLITMSEGGERVEEKTTLWLVQWFTVCDKIMITSRDRLECYSERKFRNYTSEIRIFWVLISFAFFRWWNTINEWNFCENLKTTHTTTNTHPTTPLLLHSKRLRTR